MVEVLCAHGLVEVTSYISGGLWGSQDFQLNGQIIDNQAASAQSLNDELSSTHQGSTPYQLLTFPVSSSYSSDPKLHQSQASVSPEIPPTSGALYRRSMASQQHWGSTSDHWPKYVSRM